MNRRCGLAVTLSVLLPVLAGSLHPPRAAHARTWHISVDGGGDAPTVQAGIDSAAIGDTVLVAPGEYTERIDFSGKDIVVRSKAGPEVTILNQRGRMGSVVVFQSGESRAAVLEGFTVTRGTGEPATGPNTSKWGGGIYIFTAEPVVRGNIIEDNEANAWGGGLISAGQTDLGPLLERNVFQDNHAGINGGGIGLQNGVIRENVIADNTCGDGDGAGVWIWTYNTVDVVIEDNLIRNNRAGDHGGGIYSGLISGAATVIIQNSVVSNNWAGGRAATGTAGGGIWLSGLGQATLRQNTVVFNESPGTAAAPGGGISIERGVATIELNIIADNLGGGGIHCDPRVEAVIRNNLAWENVGGHGIGPCEGWELENGNVVADPMLCDPGAGEYRVASISAALSHPAGPLGAYSEPGCDTVPVQPTSWGRIKQLYR